MDMNRSTGFAKDGSSEPSYFAQLPRPSGDTADSVAAATEAPNDNSTATTYTVTPATPILEQPPTITETTETPSAVPGSFPQPTPSPPTSPLVHARTVQDDRSSQFHPLDRQQSAIRVRRLRAPPAPPARLDFAQPANPPRAAGARLPRVATDAHDTAVSGRRRSSSEPQRPTFVQAGAATGPVAPLPPVLELDSSAPPFVDPVSVQEDPRRGGLHRLFTRRRQSVAPQQNGASDLNNQDCYDSRIVDFLDVIDPEVATLSSITNVQNSLFVPSFGRWVNRRPTYDLSDLPPIPGAFPPSAEDVGKEQVGGEAHSVVRSPSLSSVISGPQYAVLPENATLEGWGEEDVKMLNDYVRHMLHSRRSKMKQRLKAFVKYASKPLGFLVTLYATLITLFGLAWVLFLIGWIYVGDKQLYAIDVIDYVLIALFNLVGLGLAPWRAVDTYHMFFVAHYHRKTWKLRKKLLLPKLKDHNDLPTETNSKEPDLEAGRETEQKDKYIPVLTEKEQKTLIHHQEKLSKSHTFFKPHETRTHHAFPVRLLVAIVLLLDLHSCLQLALGICTYGVDHDSRSTAATTSILCCSLATNATAGILISLGDRRTRKKDVLERLLKQDLTAEMMDKIQKQKQKDEEKKAEGSDGDRGLLSLGAPLVDKIRKSTDMRRSGEVERKPQS